MDMKEDLVSVSRQIREDILNMIHQAGSGHPGGSLSAVEILVALYFTDVMRVTPDNPANIEQDRFIISKGHAAPVIYSVLCRRGYFPDFHLSTLRKLGSILQGHPHAKHLPGLDCSSGSLGQGLSIGNGIALGYRRRGVDRRVYCLLGDGELQEGQVWEAAMTAAQHKLSNVCAIVDNNHVQLDGRTEDIKTIEPVAGKWRAFGWRVLEVDGHSLEELYGAYRTAMREKNRPSVIVAETIKGKGVSFMENQAGWHGAAPDAEQLDKALAEIRKGFIP
ncbi:MAG: transketolase [Planctomycetota bacterium]|jgi:transketolase|nr:transketolase [Planctomycetota bacterium]